MATPEEIRLIIREVLTEEVANLKRPTVNEERVVIASDGDLTRFVARLLDLAADAGLRREIAEGRYVFRLGNGGAASAPARHSLTPAAAAVAPGAVRFRSRHRAADRTARRRNAADFGSQGCTLYAPGPRPVAEPRHRHRKERLMVRGKVVGRLWSTKRVSSLPQGGLLEIELENGSRLIALDPLGCAEGEEVLVTQGSVAAAYFDKSRAPVDALIIGSVDPL